MSKATDHGTFHELLEELRVRVGGYRYLRDCSAGSAWPDRGVYFFFEQGEPRKGGKNLRVVRVGTHALKAGSRTTLWRRLSQHTGRTGGILPGGGNHRGSIFRLHVGTALLACRSYAEKIGTTWGRRGTVNREVRQAEHPLECDVSEFIRSMPFLWVGVSGQPGPTSDRALIESNAIALLSNRRSPIDPPSSEWIGLHADRPAIRESGLWNVNHVDEGYDRSFLAVLTKYVVRM